MRLIQEVVPKPSVPVSALSIFRFRSLWRPILAEQGPSWLLCVMRTRLGAVQLQEIAGRAPHAPLGHRQ